MAGLLNISLRDLWDDERITLVKRIRPILEAVPLESDSFIPEIITALINSSEELSKAMARIQSSKITALMKIEDEKRDDAIDMINHAIAFFRKKKDPVIKQAAELLGETYDNAFAGVSLSNNTLETNRIDIFIEDCKSIELNIALTTLDLELEFQDLTLSNPAYESLRQERASLKESDDTPLLSPSRRALHRNVSFLESYLEFKISQGSELHQSLAEELAIPFTEVMAVARARKTREENTLS